jgi:hypothetical protein
MTHNINNILYMEQENIYNDTIERLDSYVQDENNIRIYEENTLRPSLSIQHLEFAKLNITNFFNNNLEFISYGSTSGGMCNHCLFRKNNKVYIIYMYISGLITAYNLTRHHINSIFGDTFGFAYNFIE